MSKNLVVIGLGYVGLPVAVLAKSKGWQVTGVDIDQSKVDQINHGVSPLEDPALSAAFAKHPITATTDPSVVSDADVIVVAVPTPVTDDKLPDLTPLTGAISSIAPHLKKNQLLSIESTINPGVMDEVIVPLLQTQSDVSDFFLVHCPERINPGDTTWTIENIPRVIGGYSPQASQAGKEFYDSILSAEVKVMDSVTEAEAVKIFENTFRDINIAYVNEMAKSFDKLGIDITNVIAGAATKPFGFLAHYPGNGVGGHCISVDPYYMIERARQVGFTHQFLKLARAINDSMPQYTVDLLEHGLNQLGIKAQDARIALLGLAYKKDIDDTRESPAHAIRNILKNKAYTHTVFDPYIMKSSNVKSLAAALDGSNVVILATNHTQFTDTLTPEYLKQANIQLVIDSKNALSKQQITQAGITYYGIGRSKL